MERSRGRGEGSCVAGRRRKDYNGNERISKTNKRK
jgi:hypothetical protein